MCDPTHRANLPRIRVGGQFKAFVLGIMFALQQLRDCGGTLSAVRYALAIFLTKSLQSGTGLVPAS
jgi:hypothetical protein